jgi:hypothetical protein
MAHVSQHLAPLIKRDHPVNSARLSPLQVRVLNHPVTLNGDKMSFRESSAVLYRKMEPPDPPTAPLIFRGAPEVKVECY